MHLEESASNSTGVRVFDGLRLDMSVPWPLTLFVQDTHLQQYNAIFGILLQVLPRRSPQHCLSSLKSYFLPWGARIEGLCRYTWQ